MKRGSWRQTMNDNDLARRIAGLSPGKLARLLDLPIQYADFAIWQRQWLRGEVLERQLAYWRSQLAGMPPMLALPTDRPHPPVPSFRGAQQRFVLAPEVAAGLVQLSQQADATLFMTLLAAWQALLSRY